MAPKVDGTTPLPMAKKPEIKKAPEAKAQDITIPLVGADDNPAPSLGIPAVGDSFGTFKEVEEKAAAMAESSEVLEVEEAEPNANGTPKVSTITEYTTGKGEKKKVVAAKRLDGAGGAVAIGTTVYDAKDVKGKITRITGDGYEIEDKDGDGYVGPGEIKLASKNLLIGKRYGTLSEVKKLLESNKDKRLSKYGWDFKKGSDKITGVQLPYTFATDMNQDGIVNKGEVEGPIFIGTDTSKNPTELLFDRH